MRVSQRPLTLGETAVIFGNTVTISPQGNILVTVGPDALSATPIANINAAIKPYGARVQKYWRNADELGLTPETGSICLFDGRGTTPSPLIPHGSANVTPKNRNPFGTGTVNTAPVAPPIAAPAPIPAPVPQPVAAPVAPAPVVITAPVPEPEDLTVAFADADDEVISPDDEDLETVTEADMANSHRYRPNADMLDQWDASERAVKAGHLPKVFLFAGPAGSGKTDGAAFLAARSNLDFYKADAASMTDPESWFGMRDVVADPQTGASVTVYTPSGLVEALQRPGVVFIDEITRTKHRNVLLPVADGTRRVLNPLTGTILQVHPQCRIILGGNFGLAFAETFAVDIALLTRALLISFDYLAEEDESDVLQEATGIAKHQADAFARFGAQVRAQAKLMAQNGNADLDPVATRQLITAASQVAFGADIDMTAQAAFFRIISDEGGANSLRQKVINIWTGLRPLFDVALDENGYPIPDPDPLDALDSKDI